MTERDQIPTSDSDLLTYMGTNAARWAARFKSRLDEGIPPDEGFLIGWFANAIEAGRTAGAKSRTFRDSQGE